MRICESIDRAEAKFEEIIDAASKQFKIDQRSPEAICRGILKLLILNDQQIPKNDSFQSLFNDYITATNDKDSREAIQSDMTLLHQGKKYRVH